MKKIGFFLAFLMVGICTQAQFQFDIGLTRVGSNSRVQNFMRPLTIIGTTIRDTVFYSYNVSAPGLCLFTYPKYHLREIGSTTLSIGAPFNLGVSTSGKRPSGSALNFMYDINVSLDLNGGRLNRRQDYPDKPVGYYVGVGLGFMNTKQPITEGGVSYQVNEKTRDLILLPEGGYVDDYTSAKSSGLLFHGGVVAPLTFKKEDTRSIGLRFFVKPGLLRNQLTYYGLTLFVGFSHDRGF